MATTHIGSDHFASDTFYPGQERYDTFSGRVVSRFKGSMEKWQAMGVMNTMKWNHHSADHCASGSLRARLPGLSSTVPTGGDSERGLLMKQAESHAVKIVVRRRAPRLL